jgi:small subunit ribosomal protein S6
VTHRYETVYIFDSALEEPAINEKLERFHALINADGKGTLTNVAHWGKRSLAFPVKKRDTGYYVVAQFEAASAVLPEYERAVKLDDGVLRFMVVVNEGEPVKPAPAPAIATDEEAIVVEEEEEA